jgi:hypothetical protein
VLIRVHSWFKSPHHQPLEKPQHKHTQPIKFQPQKNSCPFVVQIPHTTTHRETPAQPHSTNQVPSPKNSCSFVSIRGSNTHTTTRRKPPTQPHSTNQIPSPKKLVLIRVHSWFKYPTPPPTENPRHNHTQPIKFQPQKIRVHSCPFVVQIPHTTNPSKNPSTSTLNQSSPIPQKIRAHSCPFVVQIPPNFLPLSTPPPLIFETRFRRLGPRRLQSRQFVCTALWYR